MQKHLLADCWFYHTMDLPDVGTVTGSWDLRGRFDEYVGHVPLAGKTFLDVGTASGFLSFEAEKRGADVVSFDAASADVIDSFPDSSRPTLPAELEAIKNG
jgi:2-polyprenyl-3-methyl-5-hydroxy-6-metoxy-1,4-benzoquinol methylase